MESLTTPFNAIVIGSTGGIGGAFVEALEKNDNCEKVVGLSRKSEPAVDLIDEASIKNAAELLKEDGPFHLIINATGILSDDTMMPEKAMKDIEMEHLEKNYRINAMGPILLLKHFHALLPREGKSIFASLSAKVGSISDNKIGGWYSYRAAKAAQNMLLKNASIELGRKYKELVILGLHPGTVDTKLSKPFQGYVSHDIFSPEESVAKLIDAMDEVSANDSGALLSYDGTLLPY